MGLNALDCTKLVACTGTRSLAKSIELIKIAATVLTPPVKYLVAQRTNQPV